MFILLPLSHEHLETQRFPVITTGILILNVFFFLITLLVAPATQQERFEREYALMTYYMQHLHLEFPQPIFNQLAPANQQQIDYLKKTAMPETMNEINKNDAMFTPMLNELNADDADAPLTADDYEARRAQIRRAEQKEFNALIAAFELSVKQDFYHKYGYIPARGGFFTMFSSMFLHGGFFHLLFNMLFLWLSACNIEDLWGRLIFPAFYIIGGVFALIMHVMMAPDSSIPLIGASGAIAAVMGAFMIRMYATKIHFVYVLVAFGIKRGRFSAPAFIMLPLWLLQQFWGVISAGAGSDGGVAFGAHIGGFVFGAAIAVLFKVSKFEQHVLAPAIEKKTALVDEHLANGIEKLQAGDARGATEELKLAALANPQDPIVHCELSKAYFARGNKAQALREFKRAVFIYIKRGDLPGAVQQYLELHTDMPEMIMDPPQQIKIAAALEKYATANPDPAADPKKAKEQERALYVHAAFAYRNLVAFYQRNQKTLEAPLAIEALTRYGDLNLSRLENPQEAAKAFKMLLLSQHLPAEQKDALQIKVKQAMRAMSRQAQMLKLKEAKAQQEQAQAEQTATAPEPPRPKRNVPLQQRLLLLPEKDAPTTYQVGSVMPLEANKVLPAPDALELKRPTEAPIPFAEMYLICVFQLKPPKSPSSSAPRKKKGESAVTVSPAGSEETVLADIFLAGRVRPYRIASNKIAYPKFFQQLQSNSLDNFRQFIMFIIAQIDAVYVDQATLNYLKTGKAYHFSDQEGLQLHERILWRQIKDAVRACCGKCAAVYWMDGAKIPAQGAKTKCTKCGEALLIKKPSPPALPAQVEETAHTAEAEPAQPTEEI